MKKIDENNTRIYNIAQTDLGGQLPKSLISKVSTKGFNKYYENLKKGLENYIKNK